MSGKPQNKRVIFGLTLIAGSMDSVTGLLLIAVPEFSMKLMGITTGPEVIPFIQFIGAFVFGTGSLYLGGLYSSRSGTLAGLRLTWKATAWIRFWVGLTTGALILFGRLSLPWASVPVTDLTVALFQTLWLITGRFPKEQH